MRTVLVTLLQLPRYPSMAHTWELLERGRTAGTAGTAGTKGLPGVHHWHNSAGWERFRFNVVVELWCCWVMALGRLRFSLQRRLRGRTSSGPAHRNAERAQARVGQDVVWQIWADGSKLP